MDAQQARVRNLSAAGTEAAQERVHSGFNVIRARVTSDGKSWPTADLRAEHERLTNALNQLAIDIAAAKAEIKSQRRAEEVEIWETQLVALQVGARGTALTEGPWQFCGSSPVLRGSSAQGAIQCCVCWLYCRTRCGCTGRRSTSSRWSCWAGSSR